MIMCFAPCFLISILQFPLISPYLQTSFPCFILQTGDGIHWRQIETIELFNTGSGLGFGIIGGKNTGVIVKTILPGGAADKVSFISLSYVEFFIAIV